MKKILFLAALAPACMLSSKSDTLPGGGGGDRAFADTMADAPVVGVGDTLTSVAACNGAGYAKVDVPAGQPFQVELSLEAPGDACMSFSYTNENGNAVDGSIEVCSPDLPKVVDLTGRDAGGYLTVGETGACQGATVTVAIK